MYSLSISNKYGLEGWNSYLSAYPRDLDVQVALEMSAYLTNELGLMSPLLQSNTPPYQITPYSSGQWAGWPGTMFDRASFKVPYDPSNPTNTFPFMTNMTYLNAGERFIPLTGIFE